MSVSGEGAALRSARKWLLLLCPEIPDRSGGKGAERLRLVVKAAGCLGGSRRRHGMAYGVWRCWEATWRRWGIQAAKHTRAGRRGLFLPELAPLLYGFVLGWLYTPRRRPSDAVDCGLWPIAAFGRRRPWIAAFGRRRRSRDRDRCCNCGHAHLRSEVLICAPGSTGV